MRYGGWQQAEEANLQADVMRFMAIVAFCLIAVLAMVRQIQPHIEARPANKNPEPAQATTIATMVTPDSQTVPEPQSESKSEAEISKRPTLTPKPQARVEPPPLPPQPTPKPVEPAVNKPAVVHAPPKSASPPVSARLPVRASAPSSVPAPPPAAFPAQAAEAQEEGLSLRFASETDFLRLLSKGAITLYAYTSSSFQQLDKNYQFVETSPPAQVYELEAATIPSRFTHTLPAQLTSHQVTWAVALPARVQQQIRQYVANVKQGQLLINRYEEVTHVPAAS